VKVAITFRDKSTVAEWLAFWSVVQQFVGSILTTGLGVCSDSTSTLNSSPGLIGPCVQKMAVERQRYQT